MKFLKYNLFVLLVLIYFLAGLNIHAHTPVPQNEQKQKNSFVRESFINMEVANYDESLNNLRVVLNGFNGYIYSGARGLSCVCVFRPCHCDQYAKAKS